jgi:hypothetical protein
VLGTVLEQFSKKQSSPFMEMVSKQSSPFMEMVSKQSSPFMEIVNKQSSPLWKWLTTVLTIYGNG